jgi:hypothetical protein
VVSGPTASQVRHLAKAVYPARTTKVELRDASVLTSLNVPFVFLGVAHPLEFRNQN